MTSTFPFRVAAANAADDAARQFVIVAAVDELEGYGNLLEDFGYGNTGPSWREHLETIVEEHQPALLDHLEFEEPQLADTLLLYADSLDAVRQFLGCVQPYFGDLAKLKAYLRQTDPGDFFE